MAITDKTIAELQRAVETQVLDIDGKKFTTRNVFPPPREEFKQPVEIRVATLTGFTAYVKKFISQGAFVHVVNHSLVGFVGDLYGECKQRDAFCCAAFEDLFGKSFSFGQYHDHESFIVCLQSLFVPTPERADVLKVIGTIKDEQVRQFSDDGVSQSVAAKAGSVLVTEVAVPNPVMLRPWRTFREIEQPESAFVLRVRQGKEGGKPTCALFEADGGRWKLEAVEGIKKFLEAQQLAIPIIA